MSRRAALALGALVLVVAALLLPASAPAHGLVGRSDLPIPEWLFGWAAALVLVISFVALAVLWPSPRLEGDRDWRPLPGPLDRVLGSRAVEALCGCIGVALLGVTIWSGFAGVDSPVNNWAPSFVYVGFWIGLVLLSVLLGDVFAAFNPWRAIGRGTGWAARRIAGDAVPEPLPYPEWLGHWPAAATIFGFAVLELVVVDGDSPRTVATAVVIYTALTLVAMSLYGANAWSARGEGFGVYFNLFARLSAFERRAGRVGLRRPLSRIASLAPQAGTVALVAVMIGSVSFDGASEGSAWNSFAPDLQRELQDGLGLGPQFALEVTLFLGLLAAVAIVAGFYRLGIAGARSVSDKLSSPRLAHAFIHSLVPIALAYVAAHYLTLLLYQGQAVYALASDPLGHGWDVFGTAGHAIDYGVIGATAAWYWQVGFVIAGHVTALALAHDRALVVYDDPGEAVRSQYWMLAVMVGFTTLALWLLSQANA